MTSTLLNQEHLKSFQVESKNARCKRCTNNCLLTISTFITEHDAASEHNTRKIHITGNKCERGALPDNISSSTIDGQDTPPNLMDFNEQRLFDYTSLSEAEATRPTIGLARSLNMFENYPFWHTFFTELGFAVVLSEQSSRTTYNAGIDSMPSESVCYPAKITHGHVMDLIDQQVDIIFMPCIRHEIKEDESAPNHFNCPVVVSYPEVIRLNVEKLDNAVSKTGAPILFADPFLPFHNAKVMERRLYEEVRLFWRGGNNWGQTPNQKIDLKGTPPTKAEVVAALHAAYAEDERVKLELAAEGERVMTWLKADPTRQAIVLAGRPYHLDQEINHSVPALINGFGFAVLSEKNVAHMVELERPIRVMDQWAYHSRMYRAAKLCTQEPQLELIQLNSFGCGLDAITTDQVQEILENAGKMYTTLKIDEVSNLGAAKIRIRSLMAALAERRGRHCEEQRDEATPSQSAQSTAFPRVQYTQQMKDDKYTILSPQMAPIHFELLKPIFTEGGYNFELLPSVDNKAIDVGLKYVNNDVCYPSVLVTGQIMEAVTSGRYDLDKTAVIITQTGGGCRATNYISLIRKGLKDAGMPHIPVISMSFHDLGEVNPGFVIKPYMLLRAAYAFFIGDLLMQCLYRTRPYETVEGSAQGLLDKWTKLTSDKLCSKMNNLDYRRIVRGITADYEALALTNDRSKPRVGVVGEILVKFHPTANNQIVDQLEAEGVEVVVPGLTEFFLFGMSGGIWQNKTLGRPLKSKIGARISIRALGMLRRPVVKALKKSTRFVAPASIYELAEYAERVISLCNSMGEGWLLTAEMVELIKTGCPNIICTQPFGCLPNHVTGKGVIKELRRQYPQSNIVAIDYDPGASEANQLNRIKLNVAIAKENFYAAQSSDSAVN